MARDATFDTELKHYEENIELGLEEPFKDECNAELALHLTMTKNLKDSRGNRCLMEKDLLTRTIWGSFAPLADPLGLPGVALPSCLSPPWLIRGLVALRRGRRLARRGTESDAAPRRKITCT